MPAARAGWWLCRGMGRHHQQSATVRQKQDWSSSPRQLAVSWRCFCLCFNTGIHVGAAGRRSSCSVALARAVNAPELFSRFLFLTCFLCLCCCAGNMAVRWYPAGERQGTPPLDAFYLSLFLSAGDVVVEDDVIAQLETDKVTMDIKYQQKTPGIVKEIKVSASTHHPPPTHQSGVGDSVLGALGGWTGRGSMCHCRVGRC